MELRKVIKDILRENEGITIKDLKKRDYEIDIIPFPKWLLN